MKVFCYFNLHRKCWSIKALEGIDTGLVVAHAFRVNLKGATFKVSEAGRQRVIASKRKNVHAGVVGQWDGNRDAAQPDREGEAVAVTYNPYKAPTFTRRDNEAPIHAAELVHLAARGAFAYGLDTYL